jgi:predicted nucleic acid-binding protein
VKLVDTSVWIDFWRGRPAAAGLAELLRDGTVLLHPWVLGEIALGSLGERRDALLEDLAILPAAPVVADPELLSFVGHHRLGGTGVGLVDAQLMAAARLASADLWTGDQRLHRIWSRVRIES